MKASRLLSPVLIVLLAVCSLLVTGAWTVGQQVRSTQKSVVDVQSLARAVEQSLQKGTTEVQAQALERLLRALSELPQTPSRTEVPALHELVQPLEQVVADESARGATAGGRRLLAALVLIRIDRIRGHQALTTLSASGDAALAAKAEQVLQDVASETRLQMNFNHLSPERARSIITELAAAQDPLIRQQAALMRLSLAEQVQEFDSLANDLLATYSTLPEETLKGQLVIRVASADIPTEPKLAFLESASRTGTAGQSSHDLATKYIQSLRELKGDVPPDASKPRVDLRPLMERQNQDESK